MTATPVRYLVLWLTTSFNLPCAYCYAGDHPPVSMQERVVKDALWLAASSGLPFHVQMAGGEPTLEPRLMAEVGKAVREARWPATLAIQTNGTLMDKDILDICRRYAVRVGVSLDGPPAVQEQLRGRAGDTFRGLEFLARSALPVHVTTVLSNVNVDHLRDLALALASLPTVQGVGLDPLVLKGRAMENKDLATPSPDSVRKGVHEMLAALRQINRTRATPIRWRELESVRKALSRSGPVRPYCHACKGESVAVHPDGTVYPCSQTVGDEAMQTGTLASVDREKLRSVFRRLVLHGDCANCPLNGRCPGDCPSRLSRNHGPSRQVMCTVYQTICAYLEKEEGT